MALLLTGGEALFLAPCVGAAVVGGLLAFHELRASASRLRQSQIGRRASSEVFEAYRLEGDQAARPPLRALIPAGAMARRADPCLLYEHLEERQPPRVRPSADTPAVAAHRAWCRLLLSGRSEDVSTLRVSRFTLAGLCKSGNLQRQERLY